MKRPSWTVVLYVLAWFGASAASAVADDLDDCAALTQASLPICDRAIASGTYKGRDLATLHVARALVYNARENIDRAIADLSEAIRIDPQFPDVYFNRGTGYLKKREYPAAIADFTEALRQNPKNVLARQNRIAARFETRDFDRALADTDEWLRVDPDSATAYEMSAIVYLALKNNGSAATAWAEAMRLDPANAEYPRRRGSALYALGRYRESIVDLTRAIELAPANAEAWNVRAAAYMSIPDFQKAEADYNEAIRLNGDGFANFSGRCAARLMVGVDLPGAYADCTQALALQPDDKNTREHRGLVALKQRRFPEARADFEASFDKFNGATALLGRGLAKIGAGDDTGGRVDVARAKDAAPDASRLFTEAGISVP